MEIEILSVAAFIGGAAIAVLTGSRADAKGAQYQRDILKRGEQAQGRITKIWQPPVAGSFPRIYFEFQPAGGERIIRGCHIDRRILSGMTVSLPAAGTSVAVRYLPENPAQAVIAKLVASSVF
jgi:hypothetical protein